MNRWNEWAEATWNPVVGCGRGCSVEKSGYDCWARYMARRNIRRCSLCGDFTPHLHEERLAEVLGWKKTPRFVAASLMGDMFDPILLDWQCDKVLNAMRRSNHGFGVLTRHVRRAQDLLASISWRGAVGDGLTTRLWLGTSAYDTASLDVALDALDDVTTWPHRFLSLEPLLGDIDLGLFDHHRRIDWLIVGGCRRFRGAITPTEPVMPNVLKNIEAWASDQHVPLFVKTNALSAGAPAAPRDRPWKEKK